MQKFIAALLVCLWSPLAFSGTQGLGKSARADEVDDYVPTPQEVIEAYSQPWVEPLTELRPLMKRGSSYVFWIMILPKDPLDLRSAEHFRRFIHGNAPFKGSISHNMVAWSCKGNRQWHEGATGISGESSNQSREMIKAGFGLTTFFSVFNDGYLETTDSVAGVITDLQPKYGMAVVGFEVSPQDCGRMRSFLQNFVTHRRQPYTRFGLTLDPEKMEGGGCVNFAMALLKKAGIMTGIIPHFNRDLAAPIELMGGNIPAPDTVIPPKLSWLKGRPAVVPQGTLLNTSWVPRGQRATMRFMDPELMLYAMKNFKDVYLQTIPLDVAAREKTWFQRSSLKNRTVRSLGDVSQGDYAGSAYSYYPINERFDLQTAKVGALSKAWAESELRKGKIIRAGVMKNSPVLIFDRR